MKLEQRPRSLSPRERLRIVRTIRELLVVDERVVFAYLHGSILREGPVRDVDVAVWLRRGIDPLDYVLEEGLRMELLLGLPVDLQVLNEAPVAFRYMVYTKGVPLVIRDRLLHDMEVAKTILMYSDLQLLRRKAEARNARLA